MNDLKIAEIGDAVKILTKDEHVIAPMKILDLDRDKLTVLIGPPEHKHTPLKQIKIGSSVVLSPALAIQGRELKQGAVVYVKSRQGMKLKYVIDYFIDGRLILLRRR